MKSLFNFYLDDNIKQEVQEKLERINGQKNKGQLAALIRVLLKRFLTTSDNETNMQLLQEIDEEYETSTKLNKRSRM